MQEAKIAVAFYGLPGSGKGAQANLAAHTFGLVHFETGRYLESLWYDPKRQNNPLVKKERKIFEAGKLNTPSFVLREVAREVKKIAARGQGVVFSGSPRTMYEAERLIPELEKLYGKKNIFFFLLDITAKDSLNRNGKRLLCSFCRAPLLIKYYPSKLPEHCPLCGGSLYKRTLDNAQIIPKRIEEYRSRTAPILAYLKKRGYRVIKIDGTPAPYRIFMEISRRINQKIKRGNRVQGRALK